MRSRQILAVLAVPLLAAFASPARGPGAHAGTTDRHTTVQVRNDNWNTVDIYVMRSGVKWRLGMVVTGRTEQFKLPVDFERGAGDVRLLVDPIGSAEVYATDPLLFNRGDTIRLDVQNHLPLTSLAVRS